MRSRVVWIVSLGILLALLAGNFGSVNMENASGGMGARDVQSGLLAYWKLDEGNGTAIGDSSGNGFDGNAYVITRHWGVRPRTRTYQREYITSQFWAFCSS